MKVLINQHEHEVRDDATLADAVAAIDARPPFAAAVNTQFVPKSHYDQHRLQAGDRIDILFPVTGG